jgi:translation initiation factor IF-3
MILSRLADELADLAVVEQHPMQDGRNMTMLLAPGRGAAKEDGAQPETAPDGAAESG